jgi:hypothetical protein
MIQLKDGTVVDSPQFGRLRQFDGRSRNFALSGADPIERKPRSYTWRVGQHFDQGLTGACVAFSLGHELNARPAEVQGIQESWLQRGLYWEAQKIDPWPGGMYPGAIEKYEGTSILAGVKVLHRLGAFEEYRWAFSLNELILGVGYAGPAVIGISWYSGMNSPSSSHFIYPKGTWLGGHAILVKGVNIKEKRFTLRNSWGIAWGNQGECYVSFEDMEKLLGERGEAVFLLKRKASFNNFAI